MKHLKRGGLTQADLTTYYCCSVRSVLEYVCVVWHPGLNVQQTKDLELVQERALRLIYPNVSYETALQLANLPTLEERREELCAKKFKSIRDPQHRLHGLLPDKVPSDYEYRDRVEYPLPKCNNDRVKHDFITYCIFNQ